jgi:mediator of RNA polymerase II transcription subunit 10
MELMGLANALYNLGTTVINDSTKDRDKIGGVKQVGMRVYPSLTDAWEQRWLNVHSNDVVSHLGTIDNMAQDITTMIPDQILADIDNARNPMQLTKERLERAATENQFMNGKIVAIEVRRRVAERVG